MDTPIELEQDAVTSESLGEVSSVRSFAESWDSDHARRTPIEEATFVVVESGEIRFYVCPRIEVDIPTALEDIQTFSFTLAPRNRDRLRQLSLMTRRLPDPNGRDRQRVTVDHVLVVSEADQCRSKPRARCASRAGLIEVSAGTYGIASHRDHVHLLYQLDFGHSAVSPNLLRQLRIVQRTSYVAAVSQPIMRNGLRAGERFTRLDPTLLDKEGTQFVLASGERVPEGGKAALSHS